MPPDVDSPGRSRTTLGCSDATCGTPSARRSPDKSRLPFALYVRNDNRRPRLVKLIATCGPLDVDDPQPAITVTMPDRRLTAPQPLTRLDWQRFSRFLAIGDSRRPQTPALGLTPAQPRAKGQALWTPVPLALAFPLRAAFPFNGKDSSNGLF